MPSRFNIQPRYIIAITVAITLLMVLSAFIELRQSRQELHQVLERDALSLIETIEQSGRNTVLSTERMEQQLAERLYNNAYFIARLDSLGLLTDRQLASFAAANGIFRINVFNRDGKRILTSHTPRDEHIGLSARHLPTDYIQPILTGETDRLMIGLKEARYTDEKRFAVAIRRTKRGGGAIVLNLDAAELLEFRKSVGIGKLLRDLGDNKGVEYVALQDSEGIIAASRGVTELSSFDADTLLKALMYGGTSFTRTAAFEAHDVFEVLRPLVVDDEVLGVVRIGLSMEEIHATEERMIRRMVIMSLVLIGLGALVMTAIVANQNYRMAKRKLTTVETFTGNVLAHMHDAVVTLDAEGKISLFNTRAQELFGVKEDTAIGKTLDALREGSASGLADLFSVTEHDPERTIRCGNGVEKIVSVSASATRNETWAIESRTVVVRDLTEARRLQHEIQRKEKLSAMGELASGVAHEIRNPLNAIAMIAQRFEGEFTPKEEEQEYRSLTKVLKAETQRVNTIIEQFLKFARPAKLKMQEVEARDFVEHVSKLFEGQARARGMQFTVEGDCNASVRMDAEQMTQALLNLLQNALDATPAGGRIELAYACDNDHIHFSVKDRGIGIARENLNKIFNLYYSTKPEGTGLGLAITHQIVSEHQGRIDVESAEGVGSQFTVTLPMHA